MTSVNTTVSTIWIPSFSLYISIQFDFTAYLRRLYLSANITLLNTDNVIVAEPDFLLYVSLLITRTSPRTVQNYMIWRFLMGLVDYMPQKFRAIKATFDAIFEGTTADNERALTCGSYTNSLMGFAVSKLYVQQYFDTYTRSQVI